MSPRTTEQFEVMREAAIQNILSSALSVFLEKGFYGATMSDIAKRAGISKGSTYHYFKSKEELLRAIMEQRLAETTKVISESRHQGTPEQQLEHIVNVSIMHLEHNVELYRFYFSLSLQPGAAAVMVEIGPLLQEWMTSIYNYQLKLFQQIHPEDAQLQTIYFRSIYQGIVLDYVVAPKLYPLQLIKERLLSQFIRKAK